MGKWEDVSGLVNTLGQFGIAKQHLFQAGREMLLLFQTLVDLAGGYAEGLSPSKTILTTKEVLAQVKGLTAAILEKLPDGEEKKIEEMRQVVFQSILGVLEAEVGKLSRSPSSKSQLKREALEAIMTTLRKEVEGKKGKVHDAAA